jgi:hypothetical protein
LNEKKVDRVQHREKELKENTEILFSPLEGGERRCIEPVEMAVALLPQRHKEKLMY